MVRRNSDRLGGPEIERDESSPLPMVNSKEENIFSFVCPTEFVELPSKGLLYPEEHPLHGVDTVEIKHMTAKEEDLLTSEALLRKGIALDRLLQSVVVNKTIKIDELLIGDKNALLIASRITGYGPFYDTTINCPSCGVVKNEQINLNELKTKASELPEGVRSTDGGTYAIHIEDMQLDIEVRLLRGLDEKKVAAARSKKRKLKLPETNITDQLEAIVVSVNNMNDFAVIKQFAAACPASVSRKLRKVYEQLTPDIDLTFEFECDGCGHLAKVGMPLTADFFWPNA